MKILSTDGFVDFEDILDQGVRPTLKIFFDDNTHIVCTLNHQFFIEDSYWDIAENLYIGDMLSEKMIVDIKEHSETQVYDFYNVGNCHNYYANGVINHNCNMLVCDEVAIIPNSVADEFFASTYPVISAGKTTKIIMTSTPLGYNHFWKFWNDAKNKRNDFVTFNVPYWKVPGRDDAWAKEQLRLLGETKYNQEILCDFLGSSKVLIRPDVLGKMSFNHPVYTKDGLDVYEMSEKDHIYVMTVDTSKGVGGDYSALSIIDVTTTPYRLVAKYRDNQIAPMLFPSVIFRLAKEYNDAYVLIEINSTEQVPHILYTEYEYENLLFVLRDSKGQRVTSGFGAVGRSQLGVNIDRKTKRLGCFSLKSLIEEQKLLVFDADIISEFSTFIESKGSYEADEGYHDDLVMSLVLFGWLTTNYYFRELTDINLRKIMYEKKIQEIEEDMLPVGHMDNGSVVDIDDMVNSGDVWAPWNHDESPYKVPDTYLNNRL